MRSSFVVPGLKRPGNRLVWIMPCGTRVKTLAYRLSRRSQEYPDRGHQGVIYFSSGVLGAGVQGFWNGWAFPLRIPELRISAICPQESYTIRMWAYGSGWVFFSAGVSEFWNSWASTPRTPALRNPHQGQSRQTSTLGTPEPWTLTPGMTALKTSEPRTPNSRTKNSKILRLHR